MEFLLSRHYQIVTEASAGDGDAEEYGTVIDREPMTFREVVAHFREMQEPSAWPIRSAEDCHHVWASSEPQTDYATGDERTESVHVLDIHGGDVNPRIMYRILRLANLA